MSSPTVDLLDNEICPSVVITLGRKEYRLAFSMASVLAFKSKTGRNMFTQAGWTNFSLRDDPESVLAFFWAALQTYHPQVTFDEVLRLANFGNMTLISKKCEEALEVYMPKKDVDVGEPKPTTEVPLSVGSTSGA